MTDQPYLRSEDLRAHEGQSVTLKITTSMRSIQGSALIDSGDGRPPVKAPVTMTQPEEIDGKLEKVDEHFVHLRIGNQTGSTAIEKIPVRAICGMRIVSNLTSPVHTLS